MKQKILIVDDERYNITLLAEILKSDYRIIVAKTGEEAIRKAESPEPPALILLDVMMPGMDGNEVCRRLKTDENTKNIPVIFVTAKGEAEDEACGLELGAVDYIAKPVNSAVVRSRVRTHLALRNAHQKLEEQNAELCEAHKKIMDSIRYAERIQSSILSPSLENIVSYFPDSFTIWLPKDVVSGDLIFSDISEDNIVMAVIDCTGHGVPGAFMTMIAFSGLKKIIREERCCDPPEILKKLNVYVKTMLSQNKKQAISDDGLDAAVVLIKSEEKSVTFAGARLPLYFIQDNGEICFIKGDRQSIGYKKSDPDFSFTGHTIAIRKGMCFYMLTDGFLEQLGGEKRRQFGRRRFKEMLKEYREKSLSRQWEIFLNTFEGYKRDNERQDDVTLLGFRV